MDISRPVRRLVLAAAFLTGLVLVPSARLQADTSGDSHMLYEHKCARCHEPHAGAFARKRLALRDGAVVGVESGRPVMQALQKHFATGLTLREIEAIASLFADQIASGGVFKAKCIMCHSSARDLALTWLYMRDARIVGRYSGRDIEAFLRFHGAADAEEAVILMNALRSHGMPAP